MPRGAPLVCNLSRRFRRTFHGGTIVAKSLEDPETEELLQKAGTRGTELQILLERHRERLRRMIAVRLDSRLASLVDPSDVVQEALTDASNKLDGYLRDRPLPFYPWLRRLATERIIQFHRRHLGTQKRNVTRERRLEPALPEDSAIRLAEYLAASGTSPSQQVLRDEQARRVRAVLERLAPNDREVLVMFYLEELDFGEIAAALAITENAAKVRHFRAMERLRKLLEGHDLGEPGQ
jgi:RNA polymerase sigma-70 factor, ECF subfamily